MTDKTLGIAESKFVQQSFKPPFKPPLVIGLTGGIGSGKSTIATHFASFPVAVIDSDQIAHRLTSSDGAAIPLIVAQFGVGMIDKSGALNRVAMRQLVFNDRAARQQLEALIHPLIRQQMIRDSAHAAQEQNFAYQIWMIPLLVEHIDDWRAMVHRILLIDCEVATQRARVQARNGLDAQQVVAMIAAQTTRAQRQKCADDCINTDQLSLAQLSARVRQLHVDYTDLAQTF